MGRVHIIYYNYLTPDGTKMSIGGIQSYITNLLEVLHELGISVSIYQRGDVDFKKEINGVCIFGFKYPNIPQKMMLHLFNKAKKFIDKKKDLLIFGCETTVVPCVGYKTIAVQHGIFWDKPSFLGCGKTRYFLEYIKQCIRSWKIIKRDSLVKTLVCVDYNFVNWYRALVPYPTINLVTIPNFCQTLHNIPSKNVAELRIIFARRFFTYRGTRIFTDAIFRLLKENNDIYVTVAGEGPDEDYIKSKLQQFEKVEFIRYSSEESMRIHEDKHIAVIPTLGSEGTSLSLLEAMASGCAPICTNVGGMTNIVINNYNGLIIPPTEEALYCAIKELVNNSDLRNRISFKAFETAKEAFSIERWKESWKTIIKNEFA